MRIGELAALTGEKAATIRYYERRGVLSAPARSGSGYRSYGNEVVTQLRLIRWAQGVGFTLREIRGLLGVVSAHARRPGAQVRARFAQKLSEVESRIQRLSSIRDQLRELAACRCRGRSDPGPRSPGGPMKNHEAQRRQGP